MIYEFPFNNVDDIEFEECLTTNNFNCEFTNRLHDNGLTDYLLNLSKNEIFKSLDSKYYTTEHFNNRFRRYKNEVELSVFHLNIHSLNSKQRGLCTLIDFLDIDFDILILSEIWTCNITFYQNIFEGYCFLCDLPKNSSVGGVGMYVKKILFVRKVMTFTCL